MISNRLRLYLFILFGALCSAEVRAEDVVATEATDQSKLEFFESQVRPLLLNACGDCHGEKKQWSGLRLDSREKVLAGGDLGPAVVPGDPARSLLITAVQRTGDLEMPPENPLTAEQISVLVKWVEMGAPWPDEAPRTDREELFRTHWAFQPLAKPGLPDVQSSEWCQTSIDPFILKLLQEAGLTPAAPASRYQLIRRVTYDLTGLPPTAEEVEEFLRDSSPDAYRKVVDRLLDSPAYGEHWGRKWLDLARYADTKGYVYGREERRFVHAWTYRDWVINAFNNDLPYNEFLMLQIAADQHAPQDTAAQAAMGFLTVGRRFLGNSHDIIDDRIDVLGRTTLGLSFGCARCHDHKFDPIPTADYYGLYGVFRNSVEVMLPLTPDATSGNPEFDQGLKERQAAFRQAMETRGNETAQRVRDRVADYLFAQTEMEKYPDVSFSQIALVTDILPAYVMRWENFLKRAKLSQDPVFEAWRRYVEIPKEEFANKAEEVTKGLQSLDQNRIHPRVAAAFTTPPASMREVADRYGELFREIDSQWKSLCKHASEIGQPAPEALPDARAEQLRGVLYGPNSPCSLPDSSIVETEFYFDTNTTVALWKLQGEVDRWLIDQAAAPPYTVRMTDRKMVEEPRIFRRGNPATKGDEVPRQLPVVIGGEERQPFQHGSGRLELARGIVDPQNPLTPRVWVNRIWQHHFGRGIVPTPSDFGTRAAPPEHLALLDWLAGKLIAEGWSTKAIHREILLSATYQQGGGPEEAAKRELAEQVDPENRLLWKVPPHRLSFEELRDSMLAASGKLDRTIGGRGATLITSNDMNRRRTVYGYIDRQFLPSVFRVFDFANPDLHIPSRSETTVSQQALYALNNPFVAARSRDLAASVTGIPELTDAERIHKLYEAAYQRAPSVEEVHFATQFLSESESESQPSLTPRQLAWSYGYGRVNAAGTGVEEFHPLPHFTGTAWQGGEKFPDGPLGWVQLTAEGGHPGNDLAHACIRRWTAAEAGTISIHSRARHEVAAGDGIRCWILSSRHGLLNSFTLHQSSQDLTVASVTVQPGDTINFVVDILAQLNSDQHLWELSLEASPVLAGMAADPDGAMSWNSRRDFAGPQVAVLTPWEQLAQVLLLSNEFLFVD